MSKQCSFCSKKYGLFGDSQFSLKNGMICGKCIRNTGFLVNVDSRKAAKFLETQTVSQVQEIIDNPEKMEEVKSGLAPKSHNAAPKAKCALCGENIFRGDQTLDFEQGAKICTKCIDKYYFSSNGRSSIPVGSAVKWARSHSISDFNKYIENGKDYRDIIAGQEEANNEIADFKKNAIKYRQYYISAKDRKILIDKTLFTEAKFVKANEIVSYRVNEKGHNEHKRHVVTRAATGAIIAGSVGAILGGTTGGKNNESIDHLGLIINLLDGSNFEIVYISGKTKSNGIVSKAAYKNLNDTVSILDSWIAQKEPENKAKSVAEEKEITDDIPDEIRKYKKLADDGIITNDEFEAKKKQLLGL